MQSDTPAIDREKTCPFLLRCFWKANRSGALLDYKGVLPANEVQIYTWRDATLGEIGDLLKDAVSSSRERNSAIEFSFSLVYPDKNGTNMMKKVFIDKHLVFCRLICVICRIDWACCLWPNRS